MARPFGRPAPDPGTSHPGPRTGGPRQAFLDLRLPALLAPLVCACLAQAVAARPVATPSFAPVVIRNAEPGCRPAAGRACAHVVLRGLRVRALAGPAATAIQRQLDWALAGEEGVGETPRGLASEFVAEFLSFRRRVPTAAPWFLERRVRLLSQRPRLLSFVIESVRFAGGAHPAKDVRFLDLDPATGAPITLGDLLAPSGVERLRRVARQALRAGQIVRAGAASGSATSDGGSGPGPAWALSDDDDDQELDLPDSIGVTDDSLLLAWDAYELGPYATGPLTVEVELPRLRGLLRADGPLAER